MIAPEVPEHTASSWPALPWRDWEPTVSTLHMWMQIVGKVRMVLAPPLNHWWHVPLYVSPRGIATSPIPFEDRLFQVDFDFVEHRLQITDDEPGSFTMALEPMSVANFYDRFMAGLRSRRIDVRIYTKPVEVAEAIPFESDEIHHSYDPDHAAALWQGFVQADRVMKAFKSGFVGKASPVHLFWGSFDLATTRFSGRPAPRHQGGAPNCPVWVMEEAYSREESSIGWWPQVVEPGPAFYAYTYPEPPGYRTASVRPAGASFDEPLGLFMLPNDALSGAPDPDAVVQEFFESTYATGADLGGWDRSILEPAERPGRPPTKPWSPVAPSGR